MNFPKKGSSLFKQQCRCQKWGLTFTTILTVEKEPSPIILPKMKSSGVAFLCLPVDWFELGAPVASSMADIGLLLGEVILQCDCLSLGNFVLLCYSIFQPTDCLLASVSVKTLCTFNAKKRNTTISFHAFIETYPFMLSLGPITSLSEVGYQPSMGRAYMYAHHDVMTPTRPLNRPIWPKSDLTSIPASTIIIG